MRRASRTPARGGLTPAVWLGLAWCGVDSKPRPAHRRVNLNLLRPRRPTTTRHRPVSLFRALSPFCPCERTGRAHPVAASPMLLSLCSYSTPAAVLPPSHLETAKPRTPPKPPGDLTPWEPPGQLRPRPGTIRRRPRTAAAPRPRSPRPSPTPPPTPPTRGPSPSPRSSPRATSSVPPPSPHPPRPRPRAPPPLPPRAPTRPRPRRRRPPAASRRRYPDGRSPSTARAR
jgi:hypothetical protein